MTPIIARRIFKALRELLDVDLTGLEDGQLLAWDATAQKWLPQHPGIQPDGMGVAFPIGTLNIDGQDYTFPVNRGHPVVVLNGIAAFNFGGAVFEFPVAEGGDGAPAGTFATDGVLVYFTAFGVNWQFPATLIP
jgi:hypothetical protein